VEYVRFGLKVTLAVMICYFVMNMTNWPGIPMTPGKPVVYWPN